MYMAPSYINLTFKLTIRLTFIRLAGCTYKFHVFALDLAHTFYAALEQILLKRHKLLCRFLIFEFQWKSSQRQLEMM